MGLGWVVSDGGHNLGSALTNGIRLSVRRRKWSSKVTVNYDIKRINNQVSLTDCPNKILDLSHSGLERFAGWHTSHPKRRISLAASEINLESNSMCRMVSKTLHIYKVDTENKLHKCIARRVLCVCGAICERPQIVAHYRAHLLFNKYVNNQRLGCAHDHTLNSSRGRKIQRGGGSRCRRFGLTLLWMRTSICRMRDGAQITKAPEKCDAR